MHRIERLKPLIVLMAALGIVSATAFTLAYEEAIEPAVAARQQSLEDEDMRKMAEDFRRHKELLERKRQRSEIDRLQKGTTR